MVILGVNTGEHTDAAQQTEKARQFRDKHGLTYPVLVDAGDRVMQQYGVMAFPTNLVIDGQGIVRAVEMGFNPSGLAQTIDNLLQGERKASR